MIKLIVRLWRWITGYEELPQIERERVLRTYSRGSGPSNEGHVPGASGPL